MQVVQATIEDLEGLVRIFDQYRVFYKKPSDLDGARQFLFEKFEHQESIIFAAKDTGAGEIVGFTQLYPSFSSLSMKRVWILNDLYVNDQYRRLGIATRLMNRAKEFAVQTQAKGIQLETAVDNERAQKLYESLGYERHEAAYHYFLFL
ncbi:GNAT family N-acetyltransferase [Cohnella lubricantis]|uniref:GNAT family N-acetyltransferase n=1 Tax=Cohnella lubricantis TaxID=2163172 RepID=A0A841TCE9_9BACL|nr:GNAT family N-acetyltransferase [Cohnella lubricantis]